MRAGNGTASVFLSPIHSRAFGIGTAGECPTLDNCSGKQDSEIGALVFWGRRELWRMIYLLMLAVLIRVCLSLPL